MPAVAKLERLRFFHPGLYLKDHPMSRVFQSYSPSFIKAQITKIKSHLQLIYNDHFLLMRFSSSGNLTKINQSFQITISS